MILVTGGTGLVGSHLLFELTKAENRVRATRRANSNLAAVKHIFNYYTDEKTAELLFSKIEWVEADLHDIPALEKAFENIQIVYHCAALVSFDPNDEKRLRRINIHGTANIVNLCIACNIKKLCYVSSVAATGKANHNNHVNEETIWNPEENHSDYAISKYGAEIEVWRGTQEGLDTVIVNPGIIIGPGFWNEGSGRIFSKVYKGLNYHFPKVSGFVGVRDVVEIMIKLVASDVRNEKFILVSENVSFETVFRKTAQFLNKPEPENPLRKWMIATGWFFQKIGSLFGFKREITREHINGLYEKTYYDQSKIQKTLQYKFTPVRDCLQETSHYFLKDHT